MGLLLYKIIRDLRTKETFNKSGVYDAKNYPVPINDFVFTMTRR